MASDCVLRPYDPGDLPALQRLREAALATVGTGGDPSSAPARRANEKAGFGPGIESARLYRLL